MRRFLLIGILLGSTVAANARSRKISPDANGASADMLDVIVQFKHLPGAAHTAKIGSHGGVVKTDLSLVKALHASLPVNQLEKLASDPEVAYISPDRQLTPSETTISFNVPSPAVNAPYAWSLGYKARELAWR